jgi:acid phosphatase (class A)
MAANDAVLTMPAVLQSFSCALGVPVGPDKTPKLIGLMRRVLVDAGSSTSEAKDRYQRTRPFVVNGKPTCTPTAEDRLRNNGSYPSGHAAIGYAFGLVLSQVAPDRGDALVARGTAFAESRLVCNVHWESDVEQGQLMAAAVVARFNAQVSFRNDVDSARAEVEALRAQGAKVERNCEAESQALKPWK